MNCADGQDAFLRVEVLNELNGVGAKCSGIVGAQLTSYHENPVFISGRQQVGNV